MEPISIRQDHCDLSFREPVLHHFASRGVSFRIRDHDKRVENSVHEYLLSILSGMSKIRTRKCSLYTSGGAGLEMAFSSRIGIEFSQNWNRRLSVSENIENFLHETILWGKEKAVQLTRKSIEGKF